MPGYALALAWKQQEADRQAAKAMRSYLGLAAAVNRRARMLILSGLAAGTNTLTP